MKGVVLAGGKGTRMSNVSEKQKVMLEVAGKPILEHNVRHLKKHGITDLVFCVSHRKEEVENYFGDGERFGVKIDYSVDEGAGTAGAVKLLENKLKESFLVIYGDVYSELNLKKFSEFHKEKKGLASLAVHPNDHPHDSTIVVMDSEKAIIDFIECPKPGSGFVNMVSAACYIVEPKALERIPKNRKFDFARDLFPAMAGKGAKVYGYETKDYMKDMGTPERIEKVERHIRQGAKE